MTREVFDDISYPSEAAGIGELATSLGNFAGGIEALPAGLVRSFPSRRRLSFR